MIERECSEQGPFGSICADDMVSSIMPKLAISHIIFFKKNRAWERLCKQSQYEPQIRF
jgi:hypothetical protein